MKRYLSILFALIILPSWLLAQGGPDCAAAAANPIIALPFNTVNNTTCGMGDNYNDQNSTICGIPFFVNGEDFLYTYTPLMAGLLTVTVLSNSSSLSLTIYDDCPDVGSCVGAAQSAAGSQSITIPVQAGVTYYIMIDSWPNPSPPCHPAYQLIIPVLGPLPPPTIQDCWGAIPVCQNVYAQNNSPAGEGNYPNEIDGSNSCLFGEVNGIWYTFSVQQTGDVCFSITPNSLPDDYDWAVYNLTNAPCEDILTDPSLEVSCNFDVTPGITGANGLPGGQNEPCIPVVAGETYAVYVSNFAQSPNGYTLDFGIAGSTAIIFDNNPPLIDTVYGLDCDLDHLIFEFSEFVLCNSVQDSDFTITGPGGPYTISNVFSNNCGSGGNHDLIFSADIAPPMAQGGIYTLNIVDDVEDLCGNITNAFSFNFNVSGLIGLAVTAINVDCQDTAALGQIDIVGSGGFPPYTYDIGAGGQASGTFLSVAPGMYTVSIQDTAGCSADTTVTILGVSTTMTNDTTVVGATCFGIPDGYIAVETSGNGGPWDYIWEDANMNVVQNTTGSVGDTLFAGPGTYTVTIFEGPNGSGCSETFTLVVGGPSPIQLTISQDTTICIGGTAVLTAAAVGGTAPINFQWDNGLANATTQNVSPTIPTQYAVQAIDNNGCPSVSDTISVDINPPLSISTSGNDTLCPNATTTLEVLTTTGGNGGPYSFDWGNGPIADNTFDVTPSVPTTYCVTVMDGCETPDTTACFEIELENTPMAIFSADTAQGCAPFTVTFTDLTDPNQVAQQDWDFGDGVTGSGPLATHTYGNAGIFDVTLTITSNIGCTDDTTITGLISVISPPIAEFTASPQPTTVLATEITFLNLSTNNITNEWDFGGLGTSSDIDPIFSFPETQGGIYAVTLVVTNNLGCEDEVTYFIEIKDEFSLFIPNAFTPNGDGINDWFFVHGNDIDTEEFVMQIFNRWGQLIFETEDPVEPWNGSFQNNGDKTVQDGVYAWRVEARSFSTRIKKEYKGHVTLLNGSFTQ